MAAATPPKIGAGVEGVGEFDAGDDEDEKPAGIMLLDDAGQPMLSHEADFGTGKLDACHQRGRQQHRPEASITDRSANLRTGADSGGIIIGDSSDNARPDDADQAPTNRLLRRRFTFICIGRRLP